MKKIFSSILLMTCITVMSFAGNTLNLNVKGMHCGGCENNFKAKAEKLDGVTKVSGVSASNAVATIEYDAAKTNEKEIIAELSKQTGYNISAAKTSTETTKTSCTKDDKAKCTKTVTSCTKSTQGKSCTGK